MTSAQAVCFGMLCVQKSVSAPVVQPYYAVCLQCECSGAQSNSYVTSNKNVPWHFLSSEINNSCYTESQELIHSIYLVEISK